jgi:diadenosine tetraphosphate (Ap4A) HIT family hydrolase
MQPDQCELCAQLATYPVPRFVHEFEHSVLVVGSHQLFPGYCVLISKRHDREPFDAPDAVQAAIFRELMASARAIQAAYKPHKLNYGCYGNQVAHVHWHLFPRRIEDPLRQQTPWAQAAQFDAHRTSDALAQDVASRVSSELKRLRGEERPLS